MSPDIMPLALGRIASDRQDVRNGLMDVPADGALCRCGNIPEVDTLLPSLSRLLYLHSFRKGAPLRHRLPTTTIVVVDLREMDLIGGTRMGMRLPGG